MSRKLPVETVLTRRSVVGLATGVAAGFASGSKAATAVPPTVAARLPDDLVMMDATTLARTIRSRRVSCREVMTAYLDHIDRHNPAVNAIVARPDRANLLRQSDTRDDQARRGEWLGPLHGFPHAAKDVQAVKGIVSTQGSPIFKDFVPDADSLLAERLRRAGVIFIGKTNSPEFALGAHTYNNVYGVTRNPYDLTLSAGGSTGGGAVALALRMLPLADGSDFGGSLRNPAAWNNVLGLRPSFGRVARAGSDVWTPGMAVDGPMARTVPDLALLLGVLSGHDDRAPLSMEAATLNLAGVTSDSGVAELRGKRIGWLGDFGGFTPCEPIVLETCKAALRNFEILGCQVEEVAIGIPLEPVWQALLALRGWLAGGSLLAFYNNPAQRALMKPEAIFEVERGLSLSAFAMQETLVMRSRWYAAILRLFSKFDYLVVPSAQMMPFDAKMHWPTEINGVAMKTYHESAKGNFLVTMSGCPALAVPAGFGPSGLPIGLQIVAPINQERACLQLAHGYTQLMHSAATHLPPQLRQQPARRL